MNSSYQNKKPEEEAVLNSPTSTTLNVPLVVPYGILRGWRGPVIARVIMTPWRLTALASSQVGRADILVVNNEWC